MVIGKEKFALWITPEAKKEVEAHYKQDNCKSQSEYIEKAVRFYSGYLDTKHAEEYLPRILSDVLEGKLGGITTDFAFLFVIPVTVTVPFVPSVLYSSTFVIL